MPMSAKCKRDLKGVKFRTPAHAFMTGCVNSLTLSAHAQVSKRTWTFQGSDRAQNEDT